MTITVVGSVNADLVVRVDRLPLAGETVLGGDLEVFAGGKGANQAVAAHRLGGEVSFVGCVGDDANAQVALEHLQAVDTSHLVRSDRPTGVALIAVEPDGENQIVVSSGANAALTPADVAAADSVISGADVVLLQLEVPIDTVAAVAAAAGGMVLLNPAPAQPLPAAVLDQVDVLIPNRVELAALVGDEVATTADVVADQARRLGTDAVITLGADGAFVVTDDVQERVTSVPVAAIDATGAGDSFCGALAVRLDAGDTLLDATRFAVRVGAATTLRNGAQPSLPTLDELEELL